MHNIRVFIVYMSMFAMFCIATFIGYHVNQESDRKFCDIVTTVNEAYQDPSYSEPTTEIGRKLKENYAELEKRLGC